MNFISKKRLLNKISNTIKKQKQIRPNLHSPTVKGTVGILLRRVTDVCTGKSLCLLLYCLLALKRLPEGRSWYSKCKMFVGSWGTLYASLTTAVSYVLWTDEYSVLLITFMAICNFSSQLRCSGAVSSVSEWHFQAQHFRMLAWYQFSPCILSLRRKCIL